MSMASGKRFEQRIKNWHKGIDCVTFKIPDMGSSGNAQKVLCDRITIIRGKVFFFECKHTNSKTSFSSSLIRSHQMRTMSKIEELGGNAFFLVEDGNGNVYRLKPSEVGQKSLKFSGLQTTDKHSFLD